LFVSSTFAGIYGELWVILGAPWVLAVRIDLLRHLWADLGICGFFRVFAGLDLVFKPVALG